MVCETDAEEPTVAAPQVVYAPCRSGNHGDCVVAVGQGVDGIPTRCACACHQAPPRQRVIMADSLLLSPPLTGDYPTVGEHDPDDAEPHAHYSIVTIEGGRVTDVD